MTRLLGSTEPRIFTPPLRELTPETTLGFAFDEYCREIVGVDLVPWQRWLGVHLLEIVGEFGGEWHFRFRYAIILVARQNGKSFFLALLASFFLYIIGIALVLGTAQNLDTANEVFETCVSLIEDTPELAAELEAVHRGAGRRELVMNTRGRYKVVAANRKARGNSADLVMMDELREQTNWEAWGAISKTMMARPSALLVGISNAGDAASVVLRHLRMQAHEALGDPDGIAAKRTALGGEDLAENDTLGIFEWSAEPDCDTDDRAQWAMANPSLGYGFLTERALEGAEKTDTEQVFRTECLCQWVESLMDPPFPAGAWEAGEDERSRIDEASDLYFGIDLSHDRTMTSIAVCGKRPDGDWHVEVVARRPGTEWAIEWVRTRAALNRMRVAYQVRGAPVSGLGDQIAALDGVEAFRIEGSELGNGYGRFYDAVSSMTPGAERPNAAHVYHLPQPVLNAPARTAQTRNLGGGALVLDRIKSPDDVAPLFAVVAAFTAATSTAKNDKPRYASSYAARGGGLVTV